jgi:succinoglycan biosynthesis transport protein ExoP
MADDIEESSQPAEWSKYWELAQRRRWYLALPAFTIWAIVWVAGWFLPAVYRSETLILVEGQKVPEQYVVSNVATDLQERLQSMTQQILSRTRLLSVIDEFNLYPAYSPSNPDRRLERMRNDIQIELVQSPSQRGEVTAFKIAYLSRDPRLAQQVTSRLTSLFIGENLKARQEQSEQTTGFLDNQLEEARTNLSAQEARVKDFKSHYLGQLPEQVGSNVQILSGLQGRLQQEMDALGQARQQSVYLESVLGQWRSLESDISLGRSTSPQAPPALDQELGRLRAQLADLSSHYTDKHPDIRKLKEQIAATERIKRQMETRVAAAAKGGTTEDGLGYSDLEAVSPRVQVESQLKANKLEIENRQRSIRQLEKQLEEYQSRLNMTPVREQQLAGLTRDYEQSRKNYEQLLAKRDQSQMATDLEKRQQGEQFRMLDPPSLPQKPYSPNRLKLSLIGLVGGCMLGLCSAAGAEMLDDRIYSKKDLQTIVTAPVLTEIPPLPTAGEEQSRTRQIWLQRLIIASMLAVTVVGFATVYRYG